MIIRLLKCIFCQKKIFFKMDRVASEDADETYGISPNEKMLKHTIVNFTRCNVPFRHTILIKPIYNEINQLVFLMGISHQTADCPPVHITSDGFDYEYLDNLPLSIVLTTCFSPFLIKFANKQWLTSCGYKLIDVIDKTFSIIQGNGDENKIATQRFKRRINSSLIVWKSVMMCMIVCLMNSPAGYGNKLMRLTRLDKYMKMRRCSS